MRTCSRVVALLMGLALGLVPAVAQKPAAPSADEGTFRKTLDAYVVAYNKGDLTTLMSFWADGAEFVDEAGTVTRGKEAIADLFRKGLAAHKGKTLLIKAETPRLLRPDLAMLDGIATFQTPEGGSDSGPFTAVWTRTAGGWQILSVRDLPATGAADAPAGAALHQLDWLLGEWNYQDKETAVTLSCRYTHKKSFLLVEQAVRVKGEEVLSLTQVIGWDPLQEVIRSWVFDSAGGFGEGWWTRQGNQWLVEAAGVRSDGRAASGINTWRYVDTNTFEWTATDREIDGEPAPDLKVRYTRKAGQK